MDTPEIPQSPQSPEEAKEDFSEAEILDSPEDEEGQGASDENRGAADDDEEDTRKDHGFKDEEPDEVVPDFVSEADDEDLARETGALEQEDEDILLMEGEDEGEKSSDEEDEQEEEDRPLNPQSPSEPELGKGEQDGERRSASHRHLSAEAQAELYVEEGVEDGKKAQDDEQMTLEQRRRAAVVREMKDDPTSVSRELDEHELDYDEEVPDEPNIHTLEEDDEDDAKAEEDDENEERTLKSDKKPILPPSPSEGDSRKMEDSRAPDRSRRDSTRDKKKDEDDGEIDEGEIDDDDLEEGEVKDPSDRKIRPRPICRFFIKGNCTWGMNCRFIHPGVNDKGNYSLISKSDVFSPNGAAPGTPVPLLSNNPWVGPTVEELPPPPPPVEHPVESAWERGLRHAKEVLKKATIRKEQEPDLEEKRFNVTIGEDDREFDKENEFFRERSYHIVRDEMDIRDPVYGDPYADPYYDYEMEALWRGGQYENFRVQYTEAPLLYHYSDRERDPREPHRDRERDNRERERRQRDREREREKERVRRKEEWDQDRLKRGDKGRTRMRPPRELREKKEEDKLKPHSPHLMIQNQPLEPLMKKDVLPVMRRPDEWKDPWRRSKSPRRRPGLGSPPRGRRRHRPSGSSVSPSNSSRSSSRSSSYTGSSQSSSRSSSFSSYSSHSSQHSSFSGSRSRSRSFSTSPSPAVQRNKNKPEAAPAAARGVLPKPGAVNPPRREKVSMKKPPASPTAGVPQGRPPKPALDAAKPPVNPRDREGVSGGGQARPIPPREPGNTVVQREGRRKEPQQHPTRRRTMSGSLSGSSYSASSSRSRSRSSSISPSHSASRKSRKSRSLSVSSVSSVSSASSSDSSARSADSEDMYADLASPVSSASSHSRSPGQPRRDRPGPPRERPPPGRERPRERPARRDGAFREERRKMEASGPPARVGHPRPGPGNRGLHPSHPPTGSMPHPLAPVASGSHKDIKLTLLNKQADKGSRKRYLPSDKDRPGSPLSKRVAMSPDRGRDKRTQGRPHVDRLRSQVPRPMAPQCDRKRLVSPPTKLSGKGPAAAPLKLAAPGTAAASISAGANKPSNTLSRREELLKQLKAVEDAIARKRAKIPTK